MEEKTPIDLAQEIMKLLKPFDEETRQAAMGIAGSLLSYDYTKSIRYPQGRV